MNVLIDDEIIFGNDSRYKTFAQTIERILKQFEHSTDWPDLLPNLIKLKNTIENNAHFQSIPKRLTLSKRLAQCLHPALPSGVHLKTLEVYETIFRIIDRRYLQRDILLYSYGLFPLLSLAALPVKPVILAIYEKYFLSLGEALNPILTGFLIGLFSALEEGADYYTKVVNLLDNLANHSDEFYFYTCIWSAIHLTASVRYSAITYILHHFDKRKSMEDQIYLIGLSVETMVAAVCTCLYDNEQALVQRSILDFLLVCLPMHNNQLTKINLMKIITGTFYILLKRDMSLNRRIYTWFLGANELCKDNNNQSVQIDSSSYFMRYTQEILIESLRNSLETIAKNAIPASAKSDENNNKTTTDVIDRVPSTWTLTKLIRVLLVLVDKSDVGPNIIESIFMNYLLLVYEHAYYPTKKFPSIDLQQENQYSETLKTFNMLLDTLEPYFIWEFLTKNFDYILNQQQDNKSTTAGCTIEQICGIIMMLLELSKDIQSEHLAEMLYHLIKIINNNIENLKPNQITLCIEILLKIFKNFIPLNTNPCLSIFRHPSNCNTLITDSDIEDDDDNNDEQTTFVDNEYTTDIYNKLLRRDSIGKLQTPDFLTEQQCTNDIERLLRQMVRKVEKQLFRLHNSTSDERQTRTSTKSILESMNYIEKSISLYKILFHHFILTYFIDKNQESINEKFQNICSIIQNKTNNNLLIILNQYRTSNQLQLKLCENVDLYKTAFEECCKTDFEEWSMDLFILSLCDSNHFSLQTMAITILIEIFGYTLSFYSTNIKTSTDFVMNNQSIISSFSQEQISFILNETEFFQYIIAYFWEYLSDKYNREYNLKASHILSILHSMLPNNLCEDLIYNQLSYRNLEEIENEIKISEEYKKFFKLWNSTRNISNMTNKYLTKSFQCCLISVLNILKETDNYCLKPMVQQWTYDCFIHGDMCRIFDILLITLLHSDTTRINIQRFDPNIHKEIFHEEQIDSNSTNNTDNMNEVTFCLTFDDGNNEDYDDEYTNDDETEQEETEEEKRLRTTSATTPGESVNHLKSSPQTIKFPSFLSLSQPIISNILSLSPPPFIRSSKLRAPTASSILTNSRTTNQEIYSSTPPRALSMPNDTIENPPNSSQINDSIDFIDGYILIYTQSYDYNRVTLTLGIIENLIDLIPQQLIHSLLITSNIQTSPINIHNKYLYELFLKHRRSIEEKDFDLLNENYREHQPYLYLLLNILLIYTYSYYPKCFNIEENRKIHIRSLILLTRICHDLSYICMDNIILINHIVNLLKKVSFQRIILCLFNRILNKKSDLLKVKLIYDYNNEYSSDQITKQYLKKLIQLLEEIILLENIIYSTDLNLIHQPTVNQPIFLSTILQYLKQISFIENHRYIISLVGRILPHCGPALKTITTKIIEQICRNLCFIVQYYNQQETKTKYKHLSSFDAIDYMIYLIQRLSYICNYCLGNTSNNFQQFTPTLCPQHWMKRMTINTNDIADARQLILNKFPSILSSILFIWNTITIDQTNSIWTENNIKQIREVIIEFISSLTKSNGIAFLRAVARCWGERKQQQKSSIISRDNIGEKQSLIDILLSINNFTINDIIYNMNEYLRTQTLPNDKKKQNNIIWCLQFLSSYMEHPKNISLDCWSTLAVLLKECLSQAISLSITFLIIKILSFYVKQSPSLVEKRDLKDLQEITMKVLDTCNTIVASFLQQTTWLRKNLPIRRTQQLDLESTQTTIESSIEIDRTPEDDTTISTDFDNTTQPTNLSLTAINILSEHAGNLLNIVYNQTDEKDRVVIPYLQNLVTNLMPYVRTHVASHAPLYRSVSNLLMNISQYSYTRKAWKKEILEQLFDINFFQIDLSTLRSWKIIIENLISNEKPPTFRDVMNRINTIQTGLLTSKEQEYEQRAMLLKRFAFVIYSSEKDQYNRYLPEILESIVDALKLSQIPIVYTQILLLLRVLLIRITSKNLSSIWPILMTELIQVLLQIEQELLADVESDIKSSLQRMAANDMMSANLSFSNPQLKIYLYACKLLDVLLAMPFAELCHFQFFRSAFIVDYGTTNQNSHIDTFIAFSTRLSRLFERKFQLMPINIRDNLPVIKNPSYPLLRLKTISNIHELFPFFNYLSNIPIDDNSYIRNEQIILSDKLNDIEISVLEDFVESWV